MQIASQHFTLGNQYKKAFHVLASPFFFGDRKTFHEIESPIYFCGGLAIEHYLKAGLCLQNIKFKQTHDLLELLGPNMESNGYFNLDNHEERVVSLLNERYFQSSSYGRLHLRYGPTVPVTVSPGPEVLDALINKIHQKFDGTLF